MGSKRSRKPCLCREMASPKPLLLETSLIGPQLLRNSYGAHSVQHTTALQMAASLLTELRQKLGEALEKSVVVQVRPAACLGPLGARSHRPRQPSPGIG